MKKKYHYQDWLKEAFELALSTGRRRDELMNMKFSDIQERDGKLVYIETEDYKYNRKHNLIHRDEKKYIYTPIIYDLNLILQRIGYSKYKHTDRFLVAPNSTRKRNTLKENMSKAFTQYYSKLGTGRNLEFRNLRKTYITLLNNFTNGQAEAITGHSGQAIIMKSYHDQRVFNNALNDFRMIS